MRLSQFIAPSPKGKENSWRLDDLDEIAYIMDYG